MAVVTSEPVNGLSIRARSLAVTDAAIGGGLTLEGSPSHDRGIAACSFRKQLMHPAAGGSHLPDHICPVACGGGGEKNH